MILKVGVTGGIASGKSTVLGVLRDRGCASVDADRIVSALYAPGGAGHTALVREYGSSVLAADGTVDRARLAKRAFFSREDASRLNALIHPLVIAEQERLAQMAEERAGAEGVIFVVEATLLIESGGRERFDRIVVVDLAPELQVARGILRGMSEADILRRMEHQMAREKRLSLADYVLSNVGTPEDLVSDAGRLFVRLEGDLAALRGGAPLAIPAPPV